MGARGVAVGRLEGCPMTQRWLVGTSSSQRPWGDPFWWTLWGAQLRGRKMLSAEPPFLGWAVLTCQNWRWGSESGVEWASPPLRNTCRAVLTFCWKLYKKAWRSEGFILYILLELSCVFLIVFVFFFWRPVFPTGTEKDRRTTANKTHSSVTACNSVLIIPTFCTSYCAKNLKDSFWMRSSRQDVRRQVWKPYNQTIFVKNTWDKIWTNMFE